MPPTDPTRKLHPSVLDRLLDDGPRGAGGTTGAPSWSLERAKAAVKRDLEWLLNSRQLIAVLPSPPGHLGRSLLTYGMPDLAPSGLSNPAEQERLRRAIVEAIARFEPRLTRVEVTIESVREVDRSVGFRIDGLLKVEPEPEPVTFDSRVRLDTKSFVVREGGEA
jgi:type VI secretion system protein ImpF